MVEGRILHTSRDRAKGAVGGLQGNKGDKGEKREKKTGGRKGGERERRKKKESTVLQHLSLKKNGRLTIVFSE